MDPLKNAAIIKKIAARIGFDNCGISKASFLDEEAPRLERWLKNRSHGEMAYMENHFDKRLDPTKLVPGAKSVISLLLNYYPDTEQEDKEAPKISKYAYGKDYHFVIKERLFEMLQMIKAEIGDVNGRVFVDSAPVMDKVWAAKSGLGWVGKHSNLINKNMGSFFFIAELICDLELEPDGPVQDHCGTCTKCIDACPTDAITDAYIVDGSKCISYFTIELKNEVIPKEMNGKFENWVFGCDICQDVCPWNRFSSPLSEIGLKANDDLLKLNSSEWNELTDEVFNGIFERSPVQRTGYNGLKRNLEFLRKPK